MTAGHVHTLNFENLHLQIFVIAEREIWNLFTNHSKHKLNILVENKMIAKCDYIQNCFWLYRFDIFSFPFGATALYWPRLSHPSLFHVEVQYGNQGYKSLFSRMPHGSAALFTYIEIIDFSTNWSYHHSED